jgi:hypothetical protein
MWLDDHTITLLREHRKQLAARLAAGPAWQDNDLIFCQDDGTPWRPDYVTRRFKVIAKTAGLPAIKLHEGRHSAPSLARDPDVDPGDPAPDTWSRRPGRMAKPYQVRQVLAAISHGHIEA